MTSPSRLSADTLLLVADLGGVFVFALQGAAVGVRSHLDLFGVLVVGFVTALGGGIIRDAILGSTPVAALKDWRYPVTTTVACAVVIASNGGFMATNHWLVALDALGLSLCAVAGTIKAREFSVPLFLCPLLGGLTGVGGGAVRDILVGRSPVVLHSDIYAAAALLGGTVLVTLYRLGVPRPIPSLAGAAVCFGLRMLAVQFDWQLPKY